MAEMFRAKAGWEPVPKGVFYVNKARAVTSAIFRREPTILLSLENLPTAIAVHTLRFDKKTRGYSFSMIAYTWEEIRSGDLSRLMLATSSPIEAIEL